MVTRLPPAFPKLWKPFAAKRPQGNPQRPERVYHSGVSEAVDLCLAALVNPGENVLTPRPEYPLYWAVLAKLGAELNTYALDEGSGWEPDLDDMARRVNSRTRAIVVINPNNPTGSLYSRRMLEAVAELARDHNLVVFADEIYDKLTLEGEHVSSAGLAPDVPVSLSVDSRKTIWPRAGGWVGESPAATRGCCGLIWRVFTAATKPVERQSSRAVRDPSRARRSPGPSYGGARQATRSPRSHGGIREFDAAPQLCCATGRVLLFPTARYQRRR